MARHVQAPLYELRALEVLYRLVDEPAAGGGSAEERGHEVQLGRCWARLRDSNEDMGALLAPRGDASSRRASTFWVKGRWHGCGGWKRENVQQAVSRKTERGSAHTRGAHTHIRKPPFPSIVFLEEIRVSR